MTENPDAPRTQSQSGTDAGDLSYDLVRDATVDVRHPGKHRRDVHVIELPDVDSEPAETSGDYGYDLARDVPRSTHP